MQETEVVTNGVNGSAAAGAVDPPVKSDAERGRRYRARKKAGKLVASVEVDYVILAMLARGTCTDVETLRSDRGRLNEAAFKALRHLGRIFEKTGEIPGLASKRCVDGAGEAREPGG